jgi:hypothetical protein
VNQGQFSDPDFMSATHQRENVQFADNMVYSDCVPLTDSYKIICQNIFQVQWNLSNLTHQGTREMCRIVQDVRILRFYLVNRNTLGP